VQAESHRGIHDRGFHDRRFHHRRFYDRGIHDGGIGPDGRLGSGAGFGLEVGLFGVLRAFMGDDRIRFPGKPIAQHAHRADGQEGGHGNPPLPPLHPLGRGLLVEPSLDSLRQRPRELSSGREPVGGLLGQAAIHDCLDFPGPGDIGAHITQTTRPFLQPHEHGVLRAGSGKGKAAGQHQVGHEPQCVNIGPAIQ
jgi:hypothetical protein